MNATPTMTMSPKQFSTPRSHPTPSQPIPVPVTSTHRVTAQPSTANMNATNPNNTASTTASVSSSMIPNTTTTAANTTTASSTSSSSAAAPVTPANENTTTTATFLTQDDRDHYEAYTKFYDLFQKWATTQFRGLSTFHTMRDLLNKIRETLRKQWSALAPHTRDFQFYATADTINTAASNNMTPQGQGQIIITAPTTAPRDDLLTDLTLSVWMVEISKTFKDLAEWLVEREKTTIDRTISSTICHVHNEFYVPHPFSPFLEQNPAGTESSIVPAQPPPSTDLLVIGTTHHSTNESTEILGKVPFSIVTYYDLDAMFNGIVQWTRDVESCSRELVDLAFLDEMENGVKNGGEVVEEEEEEEEVILVAEDLSSSSRKRKEPMYNAMESKRAKMELEGKNALVAGYKGKALGFLELDPNLLTQYLTGDTVILCGEGGGGVAPACL